MTSTNDLSPRTQETINKYLLNEYISKHFSLFRSPHVKIVQIHNTI